MDHLSKRDRLRALAALVTAVVLFASAFVAIRAIIVSGAYDPVETTAGRMFVAAAALLVLVAVRGGVKVPKGRDWFAFIALGALGNTLYQVLLGTGERTVDAGTAALLISCAPILASVMAVLFLGERMTAYGWLGTAIAFVGAGVIAWSAGVSMHMSSGVALVLVATVLWAGYQVLQKTVAHGYGAIELTVWPTMFAALAMVPWSLTLPTAFAAAPVAATLGVVWLGIGSSVGGFLAWSYAIRRLPVVVSSNALFGVPVAAFVIGLIFLGEVPSAWAILGGAFVLGGVALAQTWGRPARVVVPEVLETA